jgi:hypothetical protein
MTNTLESVLTEAIVDGKKAVGNAVNWALEQAPDVCGQYLKFQFISSIVWALFVLSLAIATGKTAHWAIFESSFNTEGRVILSIFSIAAFVIASIGFLDFALDAIKIKVAPKVYLVEFASKLVK